MSVPLSIEWLYPLIGGIAVMALCLLATSICLLVHHNKAGCSARVRRLVEVSLVCVIVQAWAISCLGWRVCASTSRTWDGGMVMIAVAASAAQCYELEGSVPGTLEELAGRELYGLSDLLDRTQARVVYRASTRPGDIIAFRAAGPDRCEYVRLGDPAVHESVMEGDTVMFAWGLSNTPPETPVRQEDVSLLLGRLDDVDYTAATWNWSDWAESQMNAGARCFLDGQTLREQNVADYVSRLGESPAGDLCWIYSTSMGLYPGNSLNGVGAERPKVYKSPAYRHVPQLAEQFSRIVLARFLASPEFQQRYVRTMLWARMRFGGPTGIEMDVLLDRYTHIEPSYFDRKGPYANQRLLCWAVTLYMTSETAGLERLSLENASEMFARWREELPDRRLYLVLNSSKTRWTYGKTRHYRSQLPDIKRPKTPSVEGALSSYPSAPELIDEGVLGVGLMCWKRQAISEK